MRRMWLAFVLILGACSSPSENAASTTTSPSTTAPPAVAVTPSPVTTTRPATPPEPILVPQVTVTGPEEIVFDWTVDQCEPEHIPDIAARAFRDADGQVQLIIGHYVNYRMIGPELDEVVTDCSGAMLTSDYDPDPSQFNDSEWIGSPYTLDGETIYAVIHNEYRGDTHGATRPDQCPSQDRLTCLDTSLTMAISTDGGDSYTDILEPPNHLIATLPYTFNDQGVPSGLRQPSNIIQGRDGYFYVFSNISDYPREDQWVCAMRTLDLADPTSWRFWDGEGFDGRFVNPYLEPVGPETEKCAPLAFDQLSGGVQETIIYDTTLQRYVMVGVTNHPSAPEPHWGVYYSLSDDLLDWTERKLLLELRVPPSVTDPPNEMYHAYPSIIDPDSTSINFETSNGEAYLYIARLNAGGNSLDRDLLRWPIRMEYVEAEPPEWTFDTGTEGWEAEHALTPTEAVDGALITDSVADDPYLSNYDLTIPAGFARLHLRMKATGGGTVLGQVFFGTDANPLHTEEASLTFDVSADGEFHDYELDMATVPGWEGTIVSLRLDPVPDAGRTIEINHIQLTAG